MKQIELTKLEENNARYSTDPEINRTSLHLAVAAKASRAGNHEAAARAFLASVGSAKYPDTEEFPNG